jgi:hypothetical protein
MSAWNNPFGCSTLSSVSGITRRQALAGGAGVAAVAGFGLWGRFALGAEFEEHVAATLGLEKQLASELLETMRDELGADYDARAAGYVLATTSPSKEVMPEGARSKAIESFIGPLLNISGGFVTPYAYAGRLKTGRLTPCLLSV